MWRGILDDKRTDDEKRSQVSIIQTNHTNTITAMLIKADKLFSSSLDKTIAINSLNDLSLEKRLIGHKSPIQDLAFIDDLLVSATNRVIRVWQTKPPYKAVNTLHLGYETDTVKNYQGQILTSYKRQDIRLWDINASKMVSNIAYDSPIVDIFVYKNSIITAHQSGQIKRYVSGQDGITDTKIIAQVKSPITAITINEGLMAVSLEDLSIKIFGEINAFRKRQ